jgi:GDPmannose 4,6-dehydratase
MFNIANKVVNLHFFVPCARVFGYVELDPDIYVKIDKRYYRSTEVETLVADSSKAKKRLNWVPKIRFKDLVKIMIDADMRALNLNP